jgi:hypothetical protein
LALELSRSDYNKYSAILNDKLRANTLNFGKIQRFIREIMALPGTFCSLEYCDGVFIAQNINFFNTKSVYLFAPKDFFSEKTKIYLTLLIPQLPGVPTGCTTVPPIFSLENELKFDDNETLERNGFLGIPRGCSYSPSPLIIEIPKSALAKPNYEISRSSKKPPFGNHF